MSFGKNITPIKDIITFKSWEDLYAKSKLWVLVKSQTSKTWHMISFPRKIIVMKIIPEKLTLEEHFPILT